MRKFIKHFPLMASPLLLAGCISVGGAYKPPVPALPEQFNAYPASLTPAPADTRAWWRHFDDPVLDDLIEQGLHSNTDIGIALARVERARAERSAVVQGWFPSGDIRISRQERRLSDLEGRTLPHPPADRRMSSVDAQVNIGWELDLFGRIRRMAQAAQARSEQTQALASQTRLLVAATIADTYFALRAAQARLAARQAGYQAQESLVTLTRQRYEVGLDALSALDQARQDLAIETVRREHEHHDVRRLTHALAELIAQTPGQWPAPALTEKPYKFIPIAVGDPATWLAQRPDVRAAERALAAYTRDIGVAKAGYFPQISLTGRFGVIAGSTSALDSSGSRSWSFLPQLSWRLLDFGRVHAEVRAANADAKAAAIGYEATVRRAVRDAEDAFSRLDTAQIAVQAAQEQMALAITQSRRMDQAWNSGQQSALAVLRTTLAQQEAERVHIEAIAAQRTAVVGVFRALGGDPPAPEDTQFTRQ